MREKGILMLQEEIRRIYSEFADISCRTTCGMNCQELVAKVIKDTIEKRNKMYQDDFDCQIQIEEIIPEEYEDWVRWRANQEEEDDEK